MIYRKTTFLTLFATTVFTAIGCQDAGTTPDKAVPVGEMPPQTMEDHDDHSGHAHAHPSEGPHHGDLVELGNEEYHAEIVHDEKSGVLEIYILDGGATKQVSIEAKELTINLSHDGKPEQFTLVAKPDDGDEAGKSSRFVSDDEKLSEHLDEEGTNPQLVVKIAGKTYRGKVTHSHDHSDHGHDH